MSTRNPFDELEQLFGRMSRQFEESSRALDPDSTLGRLTSGANEMAMDLVEHDDEFVATVDLPGFERDDVDVRVTDHTLHIDAERDEVVTEHDDDASDRDDGHYLRHERRHESLHRSVQLPDEVDRDAVAARMNNGVLTITLPRRTASEAHRIEIQSDAE
ncbi:Hsp20/alpha crystallin family protein [Halobaculum sp. MBLA0147]|uniref:Hsp20/alpha crystallin family protein n=1 Tax=Halobaculum sp. MBLA0147 TaxID=3079934 RepID=UPI003526A97B